MASFTDSVQQLTSFTPYTAQQDISAMVSVGQQKQQQYNQGVEKIQGQIDAGQLSFSCNFDADDAGQALLLAERSKAPGAAAVAYVLTLADDATPTTWGFNAFVGEGAITNIMTDAPVTLEIVLDITGKPTLTEG